MLLLALQCCPKDLYEAMELLRLICEVEQQKRSDVEVAICYRRDTNQFAIEDMVEIAETRFEKVHAIKSRRRGVGWPAGCNDLWAETMMRISVLKKEGRTKAEYALTFEADCVMLRPDWIDILVKETESIHEDGLKAVGHWHGWPVTHMNGNGIFKIGLLREYPQLNGAPAKTGWDVYHAPTLLPISRDTWAISQIYRIKEITTDEVADLRKRGRVPALFHGIKDKLGILAVREMMKEGRFAGRNEVDFESAQADTCVVQLGRYGDIINILPLCQKLHAEGRKVRLMVAKAYADVARYVEFPVEVFDGHWEDYLGARILAERQWPTLMASVNGRGLNFRRRSANYNAEAYQRAQYGEGFELGYFDEIKLARSEAGRQYIANSDYNWDEVVLCNFEGHSSPLSPFAIDAVGAALKGSKMTRVDAPKLESVFDLLPLIDAAALMVTADTSTLHLMGASQTPYVALIQDSEEWLGSHTRGNCLARIPYGKTLEWRPWINRLASSFETKTLEGRRMVDLCYNPPMISADSHRRNALALITRRFSYQVGHWKRLNIDDSQLTVLCEDSPGRKLPSVWEIIETGMEQCQDDDLIVFSNADTCHFPNLSERLASFKAPCGWGNRRDYRRLVNCLLPVDAIHGHAYVGTDIFLITKAWWEKHKAELPEHLYLGAEAWDAVLRELMRMRGGQEINDLIYHERHGSTWEHKPNRYTLPSQKHCLREAHAWFIKHGLNPAQFGVKLP